MILLDSNIIIYAADLNRRDLRRFFLEPEVFAPEISVLEVLGYHKITGEESAFFNEVFSTITILPVNSQVIKSAIDLRKKYNLSTGDSIIAATAQLHDLIIYTNNISDFKDISEIKSFNPLD